MRIAFVGKGGSGKTTLAGLFARFLAEACFPVIAIDADINQHLGRTIGMTDQEIQQVPQLGNHLIELKQFLRGDNPRITTAEKMLKTTPPGRGSMLLTIQGPNQVWNRFTRVCHGIRLLVAGQFEHEDVGVKCFHAKTGGIELVLNHTVDGAGEYLLVDMTAGADAFASGLFTRFDLTCIVVEPTWKSVSVFQQYRSFAEEYGVRLGIVANKITNTDDLAYIEAQTGVKPIAVFSQSNVITRMERGEAIEIDNQLRAGLKAIQHTLDTVPKNWPLFYQRAKEFHIKNALSWGNTSTGEDVTKQIDPDFTYPQK